MHFFCNFALIVRVSVRHEIVVWFNRSYMGLFSSKNKKVIIVGGQESVISVSRDMLYRDSGYDVLGAFSDSDNVGEIQILGGLEDVIPYLSENAGVDEVFCSTELYSEEMAMQLFEYCSAEGIVFCTVPAHVSSFRRSMKMRKVGYSQVLVPRNEPLQSLVNKAVKRLVDLLVSALVLLAVLPPVVVAVAVMTKRKRSGAILCLQKREGANSHNFNEFSFRIPTSSLVGAMPRFINVFFGDMSLVGPGNVVRKWVKPGLTGWAQIHGQEPGTEECENSDIWYIENWSLWLDLKIIISSLFNIKR